MRKVLVVANQTATSTALREAIEEMLATGPTSFALVVPATQPRDQLFTTDGTAHGLAHKRLLSAIEKFRQWGADDVEGWVGDASPYSAIVDALRDHEIDEVVVSTFPRAFSRWLHLDFVSRIRNEYEVPVRVVESAKVPVLSDSR